ncbi:MAG: metallophosphoesterase [Tannerellaceae bacterium]|jgi:hypothetical protein|nr:metallophosphoesterase [Tannerellaceae bacterium]
MKKQLFFIGWLLSMSFIISAQDRADQQHLTDPNSFSMILLGDPQGYTKYDLNQPLFELCMAWISDNIDHLNIKAVLCTGDVIEQNDNIIRNRRMVNQTSREMWEAGSRAFKWLDNKIPYIISPGNHEYGWINSENGNTYFPDYFPFERNTAWRDICVSALPNRNGIPSLENAAFEITGPNWNKILVITTEFYPRNEVLEWAKNLATSGKYKDTPVIFMTHGYMEGHGKENQRIEREGYKLSPGNAGQAIWEKLIYPSSNIRLVTCGHTTGKVNVFRENVGYRIDKNNNGKDVHQMMFNVQALGGGYEGNGGDGWLRILEFMPDGKTIKVKTYSPFFGISPSTKHLAHRTESYDQFDIVIE